MANVEIPLLVFILADGENSFRLGRKSLRYLSSFSSSTRKPDVEDALRFSVRVICPDENKVSYFAWMRTDYSEANLRLHEDISNGKSYHVYLMHTNAKYTFRPGTQNVFLISKSKPTDNLVVSPADSSVIERDCTKSFVGEDQPIYKPDVDLPGILCPDTSKAVITKGPRDINQRRMVKRISCPLMCTRQEKEWFCEGCQEQVYFSFEGTCYCECGQYDILATKCRCNTLQHVFMTQVSERARTETLNIAFAYVNQADKNYLLKVLRKVMKLRVLSENAFEGRLKQRVFRFHDLNDKDFDTLFPFFQCAILVSALVHVENGIEGESLGDVVTAAMPINLKFEGMLKRTWVMSSAEPDDKDGAQLVRLLHQYADSKPISRVLSVNEISPEGTRRLASSLVILCDMLRELAFTNHDLLVYRKPGDSVKKAFMLTSSLKAPHPIPSLVDVRSVKIMFLPAECAEGDWVSEIFVADFQESASDDAISPEFAKMMKKEVNQFALFAEKLRTTLKAEEADAEVVLRVRANLLESRYFDEVHEFLKAIK